VSEDLARPSAGRTSFVPAKLVSPSLFRPEASTAPAPAAYEVKFLLLEEQAREVEARLRGRMSLDPYAQNELGDGYRTTSLYTDTPEFKVFRRVGGFGNTKFRVRRYGSGEEAYLERKEKTGDKVHKTRVSVPMTDLALLAGDQGQRSGSGQWFHSEIASRRLAPVCRISYDRIAYLGLAEGSAVRVTFDRTVRGEEASSWEVVPVLSDKELFPGRVICEFKFRLAMPRLFKEVIEALGLHPTPCSKYRSFITTVGLAPRSESAANGAAADV
jgi:hypothetical protein